MWLVLLYSHVTCLRHTVSGLISFLYCDFLNFPLSENWFCTLRLSRGQIDGSWFDHQRLWVLVMVLIAHLPQCQWDKPQEYGQIDKKKSSSTVIMIIHADNKDYTEDLQCGHFMTKNTGNLWEFSHRGTLILRPFPMQCYHVYFTCREWRVDGSSSLVCLLLQ